MKLSGAQSKFEARSCSVAVGHRQSVHYWKRCAVCAHDFFSFSDSGHLPQAGISDATFYTWKRQYASLEVQELRELRSLREENRRLKRIVADLTLDRQIRQEIVSEKL
jgi:hypothetical protein